jgi:uncharacterized GH25 family protein
MIFLIRGEELMATINSHFSALKPRGWLIVAAILLSSASLAAHDMWIEPTAFAPEIGKIIGARLRVGQDFLGDPIPRDPNLINQFISVDATGRKPVIGRDGMDPAGLVRIGEPGLLILGYRSNPSPVTLPAEKFNQYLKEEGLDGISALRASRNQTNSEAHEMFSRCAKSLVLAGEPSEARGDQRLGFTLELVAEQNPYALSAGQELPLSLTYEGRPLAGTLVVAMNRLNPSAKLMARTDQNGRVKFRLPDRGAWLIKAVHMIPAPAGVNTEWVSFWASLTFELRDSGASK